MSMSTNSTNTPRRIVVDDSHPDIRYTGAWLIDQQGIPDNVGNFGATFRKTLHGVTGSTASFSYDFEGSGIWVYGTMNAALNSGALDPTWECFIDGTSIGRSDAFQYAENNWKLCEWDSNDFATHTLSVEISSRQISFWFDYLQYVPSPTASLDDALVRIPSGDPDIRYDSHWTEVPNFARLTSEQHSTVSCIFIGTGLEWYGWIPAELPRMSSLAMYTIDDSAPETFMLKGIDEKSKQPVSLYNQRFFQTRELPFGFHNLTVTYLGSGTPLTLDYLIVTNHTGGQASPSTPLTALATDAHATSSSLPSSDTGRSPNAGAIAGAVVGSLLALAALATAGVFLLRWYRKRTRPMIQPLPGFVRSPESRAPLDIDIDNARRSDEFLPRSRHATVVPSSPFAPPGHIHIRRRSVQHQHKHQFNPEIRSTITSSVNLGAPPVQHALPSTATPPDSHSQRSSTRRSVDVDIEEVAAVSPTTDSQHDPYAAGYPYAAMNLTDYQKLLAATKAQEAAANAARSRQSYM